MTTTTLEARFWSKVDARGVDECWPWLAHKTSAGYGRIFVGPTLSGPRIWLAPRVAYVLTHGEIPSGAQLDHVCHTRDRFCVAGVTCPHRGCVNPSHLEPVTQQENAVRRDARRIYRACGHPFSDHVKNGGSGRCGTCHREAELRARHEGRRTDKRWGATR